MRGNFSSASTHGPATTHQLRIHKRRYHENEQHSRVISSHSCVEMVRGRSGARNQNQAWYAIVLTSQICILQSACRPLSDPYSCSERCRVRHKRCQPISRLFLQDDGDADTSSCLLLGDVGPQRSTCSGCRRAGVLCNTALRIRVEGSRTQRWNNAVQGGGPSLDQVTSPHPGAVSEGDSIEGCRIGRGADAATAPTERRPYVPTPRPSLQDTSSLGHTEGPRSSIKDKEKSVILHPSSVHPDGEASPAGPDKDSSTDTVRTNVRKLDNTVLETASTDTLSSSLESHRVGPCLWPVGEVESRLIKYFFNVLVGWVSQSMPQRAMLILSFHVLLFGSHFGVS